MPSRGYRKGVSGSKEIVRRSVRTHISQREFDRLMAETASRSMTLSKLLRSLVAAFVNQARLELPQPAGLNSAALRDLGRLTNNVNQIARQANVQRLHLVEADARKCLSALYAVIDRL